MLELLAGVAAFLAMVCWPLRASARSASARSRWSTDDARAGRERSSRIRRSKRERLKSGQVGALDVAVAMDLFALVTASGRDVLEAMDRVASVGPDPVRADLATVAAAQAWGVTGRDAWRLVGPAWEPVATALTLAATAGVPPSAGLVRSAADTRAAHAEALDLAAARLGVQLVLPLGLAFLPAFVLLTVVPLVVALATQLLS